MNARDVKTLETRILPNVQRPGRYTGGEFNATVKSHADCDLRMALGFPDVYEVGMSHLGFHIIQHLVNSMDGALCERVFAPWPDMEALLRRHGLPLYSLETWTPLHEFDIVGFTIPYELGYTNILTILDLGGIPLHAADREQGAPLVLGGGVCAYNPEPLAEFFDAFLLGEGEEAVPEILGRVRQLKKSGAPREDVLTELARIPGVYVPSLYTAHYRDDVFTGVTAAKGAPIPVTKRFVRDLDNAPFPHAPVQPGIEAVHDRGQIEILRGCTRGCRFCNAGMIYRPARERSAQCVLDTAHRLYDAWGCEEISLLAFNATDYAPLEQVIQGLDEFALPRRMSVSLPSTRLDTFTSGVGKRLRCVRPSGLTFAPEAGSQRLRDVINKLITEQEITDSLATAFQAGWNRVKLYFMIGLPTETMEDVEAIADLVDRLRGVARVAKKKRGREDFHVSVSNFVPKPHTPFQWDGMDSSESLIEKKMLIRKRLGGRRVKLSLDRVEPSVVESVFSRGGRNMGPVLRSAWENGCRFDSWTEQFKFEVWRDAMQQHGQDIFQSAQTAYASTAPLPWDHLSAGVTKKHLMLEYIKSRSGQTTGWCENGLRCNGCGLDCAATNPLAKRR